MTLCGPARFTTVLATLYPEFSKYVQMDGYTMAAPNDTLADLPDPHSNNSGAHTLPHGRHDKLARQRALIDAAAGVFAEVGYDAATTREIAERAACAEGLIHRYFGGKQGLLLAMLERKVNDFVAEYCATAPDRDTLAKQIEGMLLFPLRAMWEQQDVMRVAVSQATTGVASTSEAARAMSARLHGERVTMIAGKLAQHRTAGRFDADADVVAAAETIAGLGFFYGFTQPIIMGLDRAEIEGRARESARIIAAGLTPRSAS